MNDEQTTTQPVIEPIVTVQPDGTIKIGVGYTVGDVLRALDLARQTVLGIVLNRPATPA